MTATITSPGQQEIIDILKAAPKALTSREIFARAKGFEDADAVSKALNYAMKKGVVEREKVGQNTYAYWLAAATKQEEHPLKEAVDFMRNLKPSGTDHGNTLLRGTDGREEPIPTPVKAVIDDALKPCPEIDAVTREMADQAELAYHTLSEALGISPKQLCDMTLTDLANTAAARLEEQLPPPDATLLASANRAMGERMDEVIAELQLANVPFEYALANDKYLVSNVAAIVAELNGEKALANHYGQLIGQICHTLDLPCGTPLADIHAEVENISRLADRAIQIGARDAVNGPYIIVSDPRGCAGIFDDMTEARKAAETIARGAIGCRAAIVKTVAEVSLQPVWSDVK